MKVFIIILLILGCTAATVYIALQRIEVITSGKDTLKGIKLFCVIVDDLKPDIISLDLDKYSIQKDVVLKLRMAGIDVLPEEEFLRTFRTPYLLVNLNQMIDNNFIIYIISINFKQKMFWGINPNTLVSSVTTWQHISVRSIGVQKAQTIQKQTRKEAISDGVDIFLKDYLAVNSKK